MPPVESPCPPGKGLQCTRTVEFHGVLLLPMAYIAYLHFFFEKEEVL